MRACVETLVKGRVVSVRPVEREEVYNLLARTPGVRSPGALYSTLRAVARNRGAGQYVLLRDVDGNAVDVLIVSCSLEEQTNPSVTPRMGVMAAAFRAAK